MTITDTRNSLLMRIRDDRDRDSWCDFVDVYRPMIYRIARQQGLQDADAQDVAQRVLITVADRIDDWQPNQERGSFRGWLNRVARNAVVDWFRKQRCDPATGGSAILPALNNHADPRELQEQEIEAEHRRAVFRWAAKRVRVEFQEVTWQAFWRTTVDGRSVDDTAAALGTSAGAIYTARSRVMQRLKEVVQEYQSE